MSIRDDNLDGLLGNAAIFALIEVSKYQQGAVGGGFCENELILEFPTKSMPSGFRAQGHNTGETRGAAKSGLGPGAIRADLRMISCRPKDDGGATLVVAPLAGER
jgi:hypothetical protein